MKSFSKLSSDFSSLKSSSLTLVRAVTCAALVSLGSCQKTDVSFSEQVQDTTTLPFDTAYVKGMESFRSQKYKQAVDYFSYARLLAYKEENPERLFTANLYLASVLYIQNNTIDAVSYYNQAINAYKNIKNKNFDIKLNYIGVLSQLGNIAGLEKQYNEAHKHYLKVIEETSVLVSSFLETLQKSKIDQTYTPELQLQIDKNLQSLYDQQLQSYLALSNLFIEIAKTSSTDKQNENFGYTKEYLALSQSLFAKSSFEAKGYFEPWYFYYQAEFDFISKNYQNALLNYQKSLDFVKNNGDKHLEQDILESIAKCYDFLGESKKAYELSKQYISLKASLDSANQINEQIRAREENETKEKEEKIKLQEKDRRNLLFRLGSLGFFTVGIFGAGIMVFRQKNMIRKKNKQLTEANTIIAQKQEETQALNDELEDKNNELADKNIQLASALKDRDDALKYAARIQKAALPSEMRMKRLFPESALIFLPKDFVGGDFYRGFETQADDGDAQKYKMKYLALADCTGHGAPGAMLSVLGINYLSHALEHKHYRPHKILNSVSAEFTRKFEQDHEEKMRDNMTIALCAINYKKNILEYAGHHHPMYIWSGDSFTKIAPEKGQVGVMEEWEKHDFSQKEHPIKNGDILYFFSDGFIDQFGGPKSRKLLTKTLQTEIERVNRRKMGLEQQEKHFKDFFEKWRTNNGQNLDQEQIDDVSFFAVKITDLPEDNKS